MTLPGTCVAVQHKDAKAEPVGIGLGWALEDLEDKMGKEGTVQQLVLHKLSEQDAQHLELLFREVVVGQHGELVEQVLHHAPVDVAFDAVGGVTQLPHLGDCVFDRHVPGEDALEEHRRKALDVGKRFLWNLVASRQHADGGFVAVVAMNRSEMIVLRLHPSERKEVSKGQQIKRIKKETG